MGPANDNSAPITGQMTVLVIVRAHPGTRIVFEQLDQRVKTCIMCDHLFDTLEALAGRYHLDLDVLIRDLREAAGD
jgi:hypothetical protein